MVDAADVPATGAALAGGDAAGLPKLMRVITGAAIPKQYCRILGDRSSFGIRKCSDFYADGTPALSGRLSDV